MKRSAVIYAAGRGSRFEGLSEGQSKCTLPIYLDKDKKSYITTLTGTINAFLSAGVYDFHIVVGYGKESVIAECDRIHRIYGNDKISITYVENTKWDYHGCEYSVELGLRSALAHDAFEIYLVEGDTLVAPQFITRLVDARSTSVLVRGIDFDDTNIAVIAESKSSDNPLINKFWYDPTHTKTYKDYIIESWSKGKTYESGQVWKLIKSNELEDLVNRNLSRIESSDEPNEEPGLTLLNEVACTEGFLPVYINKDYGIYNINTKEDYDNISEMLVSVR